MSVTTAVTYKVLPDGEALARAMAEQLLAAAQEAVASRGVARIAISGGNTPKRTFEMLADPAATEFSCFSVGQDRSFLGRRALCASG